MSLATKRLQERWEKQHKRRHPDHKSDTEEEEEEMDLFSRDRTFSPSLHFPTFLMFG